MLPLTISMPNAGYGPSASSLAAHKHSEFRALLLPQSFHGWCKRKRRPGGLRVST